MVADAAATTAGEAGARRRRVGLGPLWLQVLVALAAGIALGAAAPRFAAELKPLGDAFVRLIRMVLAPIIFATIVVGIARMGDLRAVGRIGLRALVYFECLSTFALLLGVLVVDVLRPGAGLHVDPRTLDASAVAGYAATARTHGAVAFLLDIIPSSIAGAFVGGNVLQVILFGILFGVALAPMGPRARPVIELLDALLDALFAIVRLIMRLAPLGTLGAIAFTVGRYGLRSLAELAELTAAVWLTSFVFVVVVLGLMARLAGFGLLAFLRFIRTELLVTFGTSSSEAVLAPMMAKLERLGCPRPIVGLVMPAGYTFNTDGTSIYLAMSALFVAQATDIRLGFGGQAVVVGVLVLTSKGSAGVAGAGFVTLAATLAALHRIPVAGIVLLLGVDRFTNAARAVTNVIGNGVATLVLTRAEGQLDRDRLRAELAVGPDPLSS